MFSTIRDINVTLISQGASSINFTFAIEEERVNEAVNRLHDAFFEEKERSSTDSADSADFCAKEALAQTL